MIVPIFNKRQQQVGYLENNVYYTKRKSEHFMIKFRGFGISQNILEVLKGYGCIQVLITYDGKNKIQRFTCPLKRFLSSPMNHNFEGNDIQRFVSIEDMNNPEEISCDNGRS